MRVVIVGSGVAAQSAAEVIRRASADAQIIMFTKEAEPEYSACVLPYYVSGQVGREQSYLMCVDDYAKLAIDLRLNKTVESIDPEGQTIGVDGRMEPYDRLIVAVGAEPIMPKIPGVTAPGNFRFKTMADADVLAGRSMKAVVVVGSGAVGIEAALACRRRAGMVSLVESMSVVMPRVLRGKPAELAARALEEEGVAVRCAAEVSAVRGCGKVESVEIEGKALQCDTVVWCIGMRPATSGIADEVLKVDERGFIVTDNGMHTNIPNVFACGDCATTYGLYGSQPRNTMLWHVAKAGGVTAGLNAIGTSVTIKPFWSQSVVNIGTQVIGAVGELPDDDDDFYEYTVGNKVYRLNFSEGLLVQVESVNDLSSLAVLQACLGKDRAVLNGARRYRKMPWMLRGLSAT